MTIQDDFGKLLRKYRNLANLSQIELAERANIDRTYISQLETGKKNPTLKVFFRLCNELSILPSDLLRELGQ